MRFLFYLLTISATFSISYSCKSSGSKKEKKPFEIILKNKLENFELFYEKFHSDSVFQLSRITFPLKGYDYSENYDPTVDVDTNFRWNKSSWKLHHKILNNGEYRISINKSDNQIEEVLEIPNSGFQIIRIFENINNNWFLVFYGNQNL